MANKQVPCRRLDYISLEAMPRKLGWAVTTPTASPDPRHSPSISAPTLASHINSINGPDLLDDAGAELIMVDVQNLKSAGSDSAKGFIWSIKPLP